MIEQASSPVARLRWRKKPLALRLRIWLAYGVSRGGARMQPGAGPLQ
jgi:hypothetical protein